jgi:hypothetical protein
MLEQVCSCCKIKKTLDNFSPNKTKPLGVRYICKPCGAIKAKERRLEKPLSEEQKERARLRSREWRKENPERNRLIKSLWAKRNLATKNAANKRYETSKLKKNTRLAYKRSPPTDSRKVLVGARLKKDNR